MQRRAYFVVFVISVIAGPMLGAQPARACSRPRCLPDVFLPAGGSVPATLPAIFWQPSRDQAHPGAEPATRLKVSRLGGNGAAEAVGFAFETDAMDPRNGLIRLDEPLQPGERYRFEATDDCDPTQVTRMEVLIAQPAPIPAFGEGTLGTLHVGHPHDVDREVGTTDGSCTNEISGVEATVRLELASELLPWANALRHDVNARRQNLTAFPLHICGGDTRGTEDEGAEPTITWTATIPGAPGVYAARPEKVDLSCGLFSGCAATNPLSSAWPVLIFSAFLLFRRRVHR